MSNLLQVKTNFTAGCIGRNLYGRGDLSIFENGARTLENVIIHPTGGVSRRRGLAYIDRIDRKARLIPFEFNTEQTYLICICADEVRVYRDGACIKTLPSPWREECSAPWRGVVFTAQVGQNEFRCPGLRQCDGEPGGVLVAEVALVPQNALFQIIGIGAAAKRLHIVIGLQNRQVHAGEDRGCLVGDIAGVRQNADAAAGGVQPEAAGAGGVMGGGKGGDQTIPQGRGWQRGSSRTRSSSPARRQQRLRQGLGRGPDGKSVRFNSV